jgi:hypothetical protein
MMRSKKNNRKNCELDPMVNLLDERKISECIRKGRAIEIDFPMMNISIQQALHYILDALLLRYKRVDLKECIYSSIKELIINGIKANIKHTIFREEGIDPNDPESLRQGLLLLKEQMNDRNLNDFEKKAVENNLNIHVSILHSRQRIITLVENNTPLTPLENRRIREKFNAAQKYDSIADYYLNNQDDSEGEGIGITMIVLMLKGNHIDPHAFTIDLKKKDTTRAKIEFPMEIPPVLSRQVN